MGQNPLKHLELLTKIKVKDYLELYYKGLGAKLFEQ